MEKKQEQYNLEFLTTLVITSPQFKNIELKLCQALYH